MLICCYVGTLEIWLCWWCLFLLLILYQCFFLKLGWVLGALLIREGGFSVLLLHCCLCCTISILLHVSWSYHCYICHHCCTSSIVAAIVCKSCHWHCCGCIIAVIVVLSSSLSLLCCHHCFHCCTSQYSFVGARVVAVIISQALLHKRSKSVACSRVWMLVVVPNVVERWKALSLLLFFIIIGAVDGDMMVKLVV